MILRKAIFCLQVVPASAHTHGVLIHLRMQFDSHCSGCHRLCLVYRRHSRIPHFGQMEALLDGVLVTKNQISLNGRTIVVTQRLNIQQKKPCSQHSLWLQQICEYGEQRPKCWLNAHTSNTKYEVRIETCDHMFTCEPKPVLFQPEFV